MTIRRLAAVSALLFASIAFADPTYSVMLAAVGPNKISVIKVVKDRTGLGLKESKDLVEAPLPKLVKDKLDKASADSLSQALIAAGASVVTATADGTVPAPGSTVTLTECGPKKIEMIKIVREVTGLGLREAKDLVEKTPRVVKKGMSAADAEALANRLQFAGGTAKVASDAP